MRVQRKYEYGANIPSKTSGFFMFCLQRCKYALYYARKRHCTGSMWKVVIFKIIINIDDQSIKSTEYFIVSWV